MQLPPELTAGPDRLDLARLQASDPDRFPLLLNSASYAEQTPASNARWDILFCTNGESLVLDGHGELWRDEAPVAEGDFLKDLDAWFASNYRSAEAPDAFPFAGGWCIYLSYEFLGQLERSVTTEPPPDGLPLATALRCPVAILVDRALHKSWLLFEPGQEGLADAVRKQCERLAADVAEDEPERLPALELLDEEPSDQYIVAVHQAREYIAAGDVFQVNLSREWRGRFTQAPEPSALWHSLNENNPAPFAGLFRWQDCSVLSSSPERLVQVAGPVVQTRPIAGTRPRKDRDLDGERRQELISHPKERAEHIMLLDLERNDLGRICRPGSVRVDEFMGLESYAHVHHIVSNVSGRLRKDATPGKVIRAVFPGGTITGAPKVRCMQIIHELESGARGAYTGSFGYLDHRGRLDLNILIRSLVLKGDHVRFRAGAGIVADSDPEKELEETRAKAQGLLRALGEGLGEGLSDGLGEGRQP